MFQWRLRQTEAGLLLHAVKLLLPASSLVLVLTYGLCDRLRDFVFGILVPQYHYSYSVALSFGQVGVRLLTS